MQLRIKQPNGFTGRGICVCGKVRGVWEKLALQTVYGTFVIYGSYTRYESLGTCVTMHSHKNIVSFKRRITSVYYIYRCKVVIILVFFVILFHSFLSVCFRFNWCAQNNVVSMRTHYRIGAHLIRCAHISCAYRKYLLHWIMSSQRL